MADKEIVFHKEFSKGERIALCTKCGYAQNFFGLWDYSCECCGKKKMTIFTDFQKFIFKLQKMASDRTWKK